MFHPLHLRKAVPLTFLAFSACGVATQDASSTAPSHGGSAVARLADGGATTCPNGGNVLKYGIDKNGNGKLDDNEVLGTFDICNGTSGTLTKIVNLAAGTQCSQGGVLVESGPDTNNNGTLDDSEVASSTPICGTGGQITSVLGSLDLENDDDLAHYSTVETVSGYLNFNLSGINGTVNLPNLRAVGTDLGVHSYSGGYGFLNADQGRANQARKVRTLNNIPTDMVTVSFPALRSVGGLVQIDQGIVVQVPVLTTVGDRLNCYDPNATFPALVSLGSWNGNCGNFNTLFAQLTFYGDDYYPQGPTLSNSKLTSVGVRISYGYTNFESGTFAITDPSFTNLNMPNLTQTGYLSIGGVAANNANLTLPALTTIGALHLQADNNPFDFALTPPVYPFAHVTTGLLTVKGYAVENTTTLNGGYANIIAQLQHVGAAFQVYGATGVSAVNANNLQSAGGIGIYDNGSVASVAMPQLAALTLADPNFPLCYNNYLGDASLVSCSANDANSLNAIASVVVQGNPNLTSVNFGSLAQVPGGVYLHANPNLTSVSGLSHVTALGTTSAVAVQGTRAHSTLVIANTGLTSLAAFGSITSAPGQVIITNNPNLTDISALHLTGTEDSCPIVANDPNLPYCQGVNFILGYNSNCDTDTAANMGLKDPCDPNPCSGSMPNCVANCTPGASPAYTCSN